MQAPSKTNKAARHSEATLQTQHRFLLEHYDSSQYLLHAKLYRSLIHITSSNAVILINCLCWTAWCYYRVKLSVRDNSWHKHPLFPANVILVSSESLPTILAMHQPFCRTGYVKGFVIPKYLQRGNTLKISQTGRQNSPKLLFHLSRLAWSHPESVSLPQPQQGALEQGAYQQSVVAICSLQMGHWVFFMKEKLRDAEKYVISSPSLLYEAQVCSVTTEHTYSVSPFMSKNLDGKYCG